MRPALTRLIQLGLVLIGQRYKQAENRRPVLTRINQLQQAGTTAWTSLDQEYMNKTAKKVSWNPHGEPDQNEAE